MRYTIHVKVDGVLRLLNCGLSSADAITLIKTVEALGYGASIHVAGASDEPVGCSTITLAELVDLTVPRSGRCAA